MRNLTLLIALVASIAAINLMFISPAPAEPGNITTTGAAPNGCQCSTTELSSARSGNNASLFIANCQCGYLHCVTTWTNQSNGANTALQCFK